LADLTIIGGGLAGSEAAWQAAMRGIKVRLYEMRPIVKTRAHTGADLAELVCSNSLGSVLADRAAGVLKKEIHQLGSLLLECAEQAAVPAGGALAVDREYFSHLATERILSHPNIELIRQEVTIIPDGPVVIASGPLTSPDLAQSIQNLSGIDHLFFFDAIAPIVTLETIDFGVAFRGSRYGRGTQDEGDYINCPMNKDEYDAFVDQLIRAERIHLKGFEQPISSGVKAGLHRYFEGCLPIEVLAQRGRLALAYGPMRPVGLTDPRTGKRPYAVVQLRQDNLAGSLYNLVGFQTNLTFPSQRRIFRMIPGLEKAEFARFGQMHRNTFIFSPALLEPTLQFRARSDLFFAGQITGVEGYVGNIATGLLAGWNATRWIRGKALLILPQTTMLGALCYYISHAKPADFQPMKANFGILPADGTEHLTGKKERAAYYSRRSQVDLENFISSIEY
jgi:methylenetetrahydrofolate--tRNA-(uracil-5-)-methyltransferase